MVEKRHYMIDFDPSVGYYFYVFDRDQCVQDYLQDTLELAITLAWEDFGVSKNAWKQIENR